MANLSIHFDSLNCNRCLKKKPSKLPRSRSQLNFLNTFIHEINFLFNEDQKFNSLHIQYSVQGLENVNGMENPWEALLMKTSALNITKNFNGRDSECECERKYSRMMPRINNKHWCFICMSHESQTTIANFIIWRFFNAF